MMDVWESIFYSQGINRSRSGGQKVQGYRVVNTVATTAVVAPRTPENNQVAEEGGWPPDGIRRHPGRFSVRRIVSELNVRASCQEGGENQVKAVTISDGRPLGW
jgi:hypothetical protein